jgi:gamma-glutamyl hercynylcysteine S-oxide synthase
MGESGSPFGILDAAGNVWEWTSSLWGEDGSKSTYGYPYKADDGREDMSAPDSVRRVLRGGSFDYYVYRVRCAYRYGSAPAHGYYYRGFRVLAPGS